MPVGTCSRRALWDYRSNLAQQIIPLLLTSAQGVDLGSRDIDFPKQEEERGCHSPQHSPSSGRPEDGRSWGWPAWLRG